MERSFKLVVVFLSALTAFMATNATETSSPEVPYVEGSGIPLSTLVERIPGEDASKRVVIEENQVVYIDKDITVRNLIIRGQLHCDNSVTSPVELKARHISVENVFQCGTAARPSVNGVTITLLHNPNYPDGSLEYRSFKVHGTGKLILNGHGRYAKWLRLGATAEKGQDWITLESAVNTPGQVWKVNDEIVIAPTSFREIEAESFVITEIDKLDPRRVRLSLPLRYRHWGEKETFLQNNLPVVLDERAEVANLTRSITIRSEEDDYLLNPGTDTTPNPFYEQGAHLMVMAGGKAHVSGVSFRKMGQAGKIGRYPFHWHLAGDVTGQYIRNSVVRDSFQRCITIHGTHNARVQNNVCYNFKGHGFFLEDGDETGNTIVGNLAILSKYPDPGKSLLASDNPAAGTGIDPMRFPATSMYWISNPDNTVTGNVAAGCVGTGFWMSFVKEVKRGDTVVAQPLSTNTKEFSGNVAHSCKVGHTWDGAADGPLMGNPNNMEGDRKIIPVAYSPPSVPTFKNLVAYKNSTASMYFRGTTAIFEKAIFADTRVGFFVAYNQILKDSIIVARSSNDNPLENPKIRYGVFLYDGPFELQNVGFYNFKTETELPFAATGAADRFTNLVKGLTFHPVPPIIGQNWPVDGTKLDDTHLSSKIRDLDGSLTGESGGSLLPELTADPSCTSNSKFPGYKVCKSGVQDMGVRFGRTGLEVSSPVVVLRSDGQLTLEKHQWNLLESYMGTVHSKARLVNSLAYNYTFGVYDNKEKTFAVRINTEAETMSPVFKINALGRNCSMWEGLKVSSLDELKAANDTSFFTHGNYFYFRIKASKPFHMVKPHPVALTQEKQSDAYPITCLAESDTGVIGNIDKVTLNGTNVEIKGWACRPTITEELKVHLYAGGPAGVGTLVKGAEANLPSEANVNMICGNMVTNGYRFNFSVPVTPELKGKKIYVHGISGDTTIPNLLLSGSGDKVFP